MVCRAALAGLHEHQSSGAVPTPMCSHLQLNWSPASIVCLCSACVLCGICLRADSLCATAEVFVHFEFESAGTSFRGTLAAGGQVQSLASCMCLGGNIPSETSLTAALPQTARSPGRSLPQPPPPSAIQRKLPLDGAAWRRWRGFGRWRPPRMRTRRRARTARPLRVDKESDFAAHPIGAPGSA